MKVNPVASMRCWAITLDVGGREFEIPPLPAADWWPVLAEADLARILELIPSRLGDPDDLDELMLSGQLDGADLGSALKDAIEEVTGRSFHVALVLAAIAVQHWTVVGAALAATGFRWDQRPIGAALDLIYATVRDGLDDDGRGKLKDLLENEGLTNPSKKREVSQRVMKEFEAMAGPRPAPRPLPKKAAPSLDPAGPPQSTGGPSGSARPRTQQPPQQLRQDDRSS